MQRAVQRNRSTNMQHFIFSVSFSLKVGFHPAKYEKVMCVHRIKNEVGLFDVIQCRLLPNQIRRESISRYSPKASVCSPCVGRASVHVPSSATNHHKQTSNMTIDDASIHSSPSLFVYPEVTDDQTLPPSLKPLLQEKLS